MLREPVSRESGHGSRVVRSTVYGVRVGVRVRGTPFDEESKFFCNP